EGSFEAHAPYLRDAFDEVTKVIQLAERRVFHVYESKLASDESLGHQRMGAVYHRGRSQIVGTSESHGGDLIIQRATKPQKRIYGSRRKGHGCKATDSRAMGLTAPWYHRGRTSVESSIPCSHGGRALVVKRD
ncbi:hypothetical protein B296_00037861, partial [Ensete ventricosum]